MARNVNIAIGVALLAAGGYAAYRYFTREKNTSQCKVSMSAGVKTEHKSETDIYRLVGLTREGEVILQNDTIPEDEQRMDIDNVVASCNNVVDVTMAVAQAMTNTDQHDKSMSVSTHMECPVCHSTDVYEFPPLEVDGKLTARLKCDSCDYITIDEFDISTLKLEGVIYRYSSKEESRIAELRDERVSLFNEETSVISILEMQDTDHEHIDYIHRLFDSAEPYYVEHDETGISVKLIRNQHVVIQVVPVYDFNLSLLMTFETFRSFTPEDIVRRVVSRASLAMVYDIDKQMIHDGISASFKEFNAE